MRILLIHKFLHPKGGAETYVIRLGRELQRQGHEVQYFGMDSKQRTLSNRVGAYTSPMDFHSGTLGQKLRWGLCTLYSREARKKLRQVLEDFQPEICHLNNFHYQLSPSILLEIEQWRRENGEKCPIFCTAHDFQLVCPNHMCRNAARQENCERCLSGGFFSCVRFRCIHGSLAKSILGAVGAWIWKRAGGYRKIHTILCCSAFLKSRLDRDPLLAEKTLVFPNFAEPVENRGEKQDYVLYFGRYTREKGVETLVQAVKALPQIPFLFAGAGPLEEVLETVPNIRNVGFQTGAALETLIRQAAFVVCPSETYENCPFAILESLAAGTPVLASDIGGNRELIVDGVTGALFESGNISQLKASMLFLWEDRTRRESYAENCRRAKLLWLEDYVHRLTEIYEKGRKTP